MQYSLAVVIVVICLYLLLYRVCLFLQQAIGDDYCGTYDLNYPISGSSGTIGQALIQFADVTTSLAVTSVEDYTVAFVGTSEGILRKVENYIHMYISDVDD